MVDLVHIVASLSSPTSSINDGRHGLPDAPGLYALHGDASAWHLLGLGPPPDDRPLYVGKHTKSIARRVARHHFLRTQASSPRRSLAALLRTPLQLHPYLPYPVVKPASFGLLAPDEERLTAWMERNLRIACWVRSGGEPLEDTETAVILHWQPPLNIDYTTPWIAYVRNARADMVSAGREATAG